MIGATLVQDPEKIKQALDSILGRPEFSRLNRQDLREIIKKIFEKMGKVELFRSIARTIGDLVRTLLEFLSSPTGQTVGLVFSMILLGFIIGYVVIVINRRIFSFDTDSGSGSKMSETFTEPSVFRHRGMEMARNGDYKSAASLLYRSLLMHLDQRGILANSGTRTHREVQALLSRLKDQDYDQHMTRISLVFEETVYGGVTCDEARFKSFARDLDYCWRKAGSLE